MLFVNRSKKILFAFLLFLLFIQLTSCNDNTDTVLSADDKLVVWKDNLSIFLDKCTDTDKICVRDALNTNPLPQIDSTPAQKFYYDIRAGSLFISLSKASNVLYDYLGVDSRMFSGSGHPIPYSELYSRDKGREYLGPNLDETAEQIYTFEYTPSEDAYNRKIVDIIANDQPTAASSSVQPLTQALRDAILSEVNDPNDRWPVVTRIGQFSRNYYDGHVSRATAIKAFFFDYRDGAELTVKEATNASGFTLTVDEGETLFVWLYIPKNDDNWLIRATWGKIFSNLVTWLNE